MNLAAALVAAFVILTTLSIAVTELSKGRGHADVNMHLRIDPGTGCQYLEGLSGGLTPRLDVEGRHVCRKGV